jgi:lipoprotein-releasing system permease protein
MNPFYRYFLNYLFHARTRQGLLFLALAGLFLSSSALIVIQGIMGGLQRGLITRSQNYHGVGVIRFSDQLEEKDLWQVAQAKKWSMSRERQVEILIRNGPQVAPIILHGVDLQGVLPPFLRGKDLSGLVLGADLAQKLKTTFFSDVMMIAPATTESLAGEIPRQLSTGVSDYLLSDVMEIDSMHAWVRLPFVQNLVRVRGAESWRFYNLEDFNAAIASISASESVIVESWEDQHQTLMWALNLETRVMLALFTAMALLVSLAITTGLFLFFGKIRPDLASFWLLGLSLPRIERMVLTFVLQLSAASCFLGVMLGSGLLLILERFGHNLMPDIFVERNFPIQINLLNLSLSFFVPFLISVVFSMFSLFQFKKDNPSFIQLVRGSGESA